jgi:hypothetical protein
LLALRPQMTSMVDYENRLIYTVAIKLKLAKTPMMSGEKLKPKLLSVKCLFNSWKGTVNHINVHGSMMNVRLTSFYPTGLIEKLSLLPNMKFKWFKKLL